MKFQSLIAATLILLSGASRAGGDHDHAHEHKPLHGGVVVEANDMDFELVAKPGLITLHVRDHGKALKLTGASGKLTLLTGKDQSEAPLAVAGEDRLEAKGSFKLEAGTRVVASITLPGKKASNVRFTLR